MDYIFGNPENYYVNNGIPSDWNYMRIFRDEARQCNYVVYQNDDWDVVPEGSEIPFMDLEIRELNCDLCGSEMMYDTTNKEQYCPNCERKWYCE
jgi:hypothetical protein